MRWVLCILALLAVYMGASTRVMAAPDKGSVATAPSPPDPTPTPNQYVYHGCDVYPANDAFTTNISGASVDPYSTTIIARLPSGNFDAGDTQSDERVNIGASTLPTYTVQTNDGHNPPLYNSSTMPWENNWFIEPLSDAHAVVLLTDICAEYETYQTIWTAPSGPLQAYSGQRYFLSATWMSQAVNGHDATTASGIPLLGTTDWGEDASLTVVNHILQLLMQTGQGVSQYGYVFPATHATDVRDTGCGVTPGCHHPLHYGDVLRLKASYDCTQGGTVDAAGQLVCNQLTTYGMVFADQASEYEFRFGESTSGTEGWNYNSDLKALFQNLSITDFDVLTEGTIQCESGHTYGVDCW